MSGNLRKVDVLILVFRFQPFVQIFFFLFEVFRFHFQQMMQDQGAYVFDLSAAAVQDLSGFPEIALQQIQRGKPFIVFAVPFPSMQLFLGFLEHAGL